MTESIGTYYVDIRPNAEGFVERMRGPILPQLDQFGNEAGRRFAESFSREVQRRIGDPFTRSRPDVDRRARENGRSAGDAFGRELETRVGAAIKALPDIRVGADTTEAQAKLAEIRGGLRTLTEKQIELGISDAAVIEGLAVLRADLETLTGPEHDIRVRVNATAAIAELAALEAGLLKLDEPADDAAAKVDNLGKKAEATNRRSHALLQTLLLLAPALVPIGGAAIAAGAAGLAGMGALAIGVAGVKAEMKAGTDVGIQYAGALGVLKGDFHSLEAAASAGLLKGFDQAVDSAHSRLPELRREIGATASQVGDIGAHIVGGLAGGLQTFDPLIQHVLSDVDRLAGRFETWASGPGGAKFAETLRDDYDKVIPALGQIGHLVATVVGALNGPGISELQVIGNFADTLANFPPGLLETLATGYIAFRTAVAVTSGIDAATTSLLRLAGAETAAAEAGARAGAASGAGRVGGVLGFAGRALGVGVAADIGLQFLGNQAKNSGWLQSTDDTKFKLGHIGAGLGDLASFHFSDAWSNLFGDKRAADAKAVQQIEAARHFNAQYLPGGGGGDAFSGKLGEALRSLTPAAEQQSASGGSVAPLEYIKAMTRAVNEYRILVGVVGKEQAKALSFGKGSDFYALTQAPETLADRTRRLQQHDYARQTAGSDLSQGLFDLSQQHTSQISTASAAYDQFDKTLQDAVDTRRKWLDQGGQEVLQYKGLSIGSKTWQAALKQTNNDQGAARALILSTVDAMGHQQTQLDVNTIRQQRVNDVLAQAELKYKLTGQQVDTYTTLLGISTDELGRGEISGQRFLDLIGQVADMVNNGSVAMGDWVTAVAQFSSGTDTAASRAALMGQAMVSLQGDALGYANTMVQAATANQRLVTDFRNTARGVINLKTGFIDYHNAGAAPVLSDLQQLQTAAMNAAAATYQHETAMGLGAQAAKDAADVFRNDTYGALVQQADQLGITDKQAKTLADRYFHWPKDAKTLVEQLGGDKVQSTLSAILEDLDHFTGGHHADLYLQGHLDPAANAIRAVLNSGSAAFQVREQAHGGVLDFYGRGGIRENHVAQIAPAGAMRVWAEPETGGEGYVPLAPSKRARSREITAEIARRLGGFATFFESGGFTGVTTGGSSSSSSSSSASSASHAAAAAKNLTELANAVRDGIAKMMSALFGSTAALGSAERELAHAADRAGAAQSILDTLARERTTLLADSALLARTNAQVSKAQDYVNGLQTKYNDLRSSVAGTAGAFDITNAGVRAQVYNDQAAPPVSITTITADARARAAAAVLERTQLQQIRAKGLNLTDYHQLAAGDPVAEAAQLKALAAATPAQIRAYNAARATLQRVSGFTGRDVAGATYGTQLTVGRDLLNGVDPAHNPALAHAVHALADSLFGAGKYASQGLAAGLLSEQSGVRAAMRTLADTMARQLEHDLDIHSPSRRTRWHGQMGAKGVELGILDGIPGIRDAAAQMAVHAQPVTLQPAAGRSRAGGLFGGRDLTINAVDFGDLLAQVKIALYHEQARTSVGAI